ncbi:MAG: hypothetical protein RL722_691 [Pseudomonadota bacterium]
MSLPLPSRLRPSLWWRRSRWLVGLALALVLFVALGVYAIVGELRLSAAMDVIAPGDAQSRFARRIPIVRPDNFERVRDCSDPLCPWLRVLPQGRFQMGDLADERGDIDEAPSHTVVIARRLAVMETEVTVGAFRAFVTDVGYQATGGCIIWDGSRFVDEPQGSWRQPFAGVTLDERQPVVCVSWHDAQAYATWLSRRTGQHYRLLTEAEWEYAARAGTTTPYSFGDDEAVLCRYGNVVDQTAHRRLPYIAGAACSDGHEFVAPVGSYLPNPWGLYDMVGNAWEWVQDCRSAYLTTPGDATAVESADCHARMLRGGSWANRPAGARSANRDSGEPGHRDNSAGFRLARDLDLAESGSAATRR